MNLGQRRGRAVWTGAPHIKLGSTESAPALPLMLSMQQSRVSSRPAATLVYRVALGCSIVVAALVVAFFVIGVADGSVSTFNIGIWVVLLAAVAAVLWAGTFLRSRGKTTLAVTVLAIAAVPGLLAALFLLLVLVTQQRWN